MSIRDFGTGVGVGRVVVALLLVIVGATLSEAKIVAEFEDGSLMKSVATEGHGFIPVASVVADEAVDRYKVKVIGATEKCIDQFYASTAERRLTHPAVVLITENAQKTLFR